MNLPKGDSPGTDDEWFVIASVSEWEAFRERSELLAALLREEADRA